MRALGNRWLKKQGLYKVRGILVKTCFAVSVASLLVCVAQIFHVSLESVPLLGSVKFTVVHLPVLSALLAFLITMTNFQDNFIDDIEKDHMAILADIVVYFFHLVGIVVAALFFDFWIFSVAATSLAITVKNYDIRRCLRSLPGHPLASVSEDWLSRSWKYFATALIAGLTIYFTTQNLAVIERFGVQIPASAARFYRDFLFVMGSLRLITTSYKRTNRVQLFSVEMLDQYQIRVQKYRAGKA